MPTYPADLYPGCPCYACDQAPRVEAPSTPLDRFPSRMSLCPTCGDKRCPGALDHAQHPEASMPGVSS